MLRKLLRVKSQNLNKQKAAACINNAHAHTAYLTDGRNLDMCSVGLSTMTRSQAASANSGIPACIFTRSRRYVSPRTCRRGRGSRQGAGYLLPPRVERQITAAVCRAPFHGAISTFDCLCQIAMRPYWIGPAAAMLHFKTYYNNQLRSRSRTAGQRSRRTTFEQQFIVRHI